MADFNVAAPYVLQNEDGEPFASDDGDYTDDPRDPGGATKYGVTLLDLQEFRKDPTLTPADVQALTETGALIIIKQKYWQAMGLSAITDNGVAAACLDMAYNIGMSGWAKQLQGFLGLAVDGIWGPQTISAINNYNPALLIAAMRKIALNYYEARVDANPNLGCFLKGWRNRANRLLTLISH